MRSAEPGFRRAQNIAFPMVAAILCAAVLLAGCGYRVASRNRMEPRAEKIHVAPFKNETTTFRVEQILTRSVVNAFVRRTPFEVVSGPDGADAVMSGVVWKMTANPVIFGQETFGSTFLVTLNVRVELRDPRSGEVLFRQDDYVFREQYVINVDVENFFSELNPALERLADDFGSSVVSTILENF